MFRRIANVEVRFQSIAVTQIVRNTKYSSLRIKELIQLGQYWLAQLREDRMPQGDKLVLVGGHGGLSGVPAYIRNLAETLTPHYDVAIVCDRDQGGFKGSQGPVAPIREVPGLYRNISPVSLILAAHNLYGFLKQERPQVVWANSTIPILLCRLISLVERDFQLVCTYHGMPYGPGRSFGLAMILGMLDSFTLIASRRHHIIFISEKDFGLCPKWLIRRHRVHRISNCSDMNPSNVPKPKLNPRGHNIGMVGRVSYQKNFLAAAQLLNWLAPDITLHLVGDGTDDPDFIASFESTCGIENMSRAVFHGPSDDVEAHLRDWDMLLFTSRYEGMSIGALEGFEMGLPLATTDVGGVEEFQKFDPFLVKIQVDSEAALKLSAARISSVLEKYCADRLNNSKFIRVRWKKHFSKAAWKKRVVEIIGKIN